METLPDKEVHYILIQHDASTILLPLVVFSKNEIYVLFPQNLSTLTQYAELCETLS